MQAQAHICPWCCDDHSNNNERCKDAYERGQKNKMSRIKLSLKKFISDADEIRHKAYVLEGELNELFWEEK